ncbi:MAG: hypothetical protein F6J87_26920 [Spirulina sp. SIO3F2]|nr:hypothetical protein [Spirulina sp. SIO3F2]
MTTTIQHPPLQLSNRDRALTAKVVTWDCFETTEYTANDIQEIYLDGDIVVIQFTSGGQTRIEREQFTQKIKEFKSLTPEQQEFVQVCTRSSKHGIVNPRKMQVVFSADGELHLGCVWKYADSWFSSTQLDQHFLDAESAVASVVTCTCAEWQEAVEGVQGRCYCGDGYWTSGTRGRINTVAMLQEQGVDKTPREIAILEQKVMIGEDC